MKLPIKYRTSHWSVRKRARDQYTLLQGGKCHHCGCLLDGPPSEEVSKLKINHKLFPPSMFNYPVHLHHCHKTDDTIGAVHAVCNAVLWQYHGE